MRIDELIRRDHDEVADLFDHLLVLARDDLRTEEVARVAARLVAVVRIHAIAEERVVYTALRARSSRLMGFGLDAPHQHESLDTTLEKLLAHAPGDDEYRRIAQVAHDLFEVHARDEEEAEILPLVTAAFSDEELRTLARDMLAEQATIRPTVLRLVGMPARGSWAQEPGSGIPRIG